MKEVLDEEKYWRQESLSPRYVPVQYLFMSLDR